MKYFLFFLVILGGFVIITIPASAMCAFDPDNPFAPCKDTIGTLEYPKTPDEIIPAPLKQMNLGIKLGHIICDPDKYPVWNVHYKPACVYPDSEGELLTRGWAKLRLLLPAGPDPIKELEVMGQNVFSLRILGNYIVGDEKYPLSEDRKRELAWEYSQQYYFDQTFLEYAITPHQNYYNVGDKIQFDLLEWGNYSDCWNLNLKIIDVKNNPVYEDNSVKYCLEPDGIPGTFHSYSMGEDFEEFVCERPGYYRIEVSNAEIFSADIMENFVCIEHKPEPEPDIWDFEPLNKMTLWVDPFFNNLNKFAEINEKKDTRCFTTPSMNYFCYAKPRMFEQGHGVSYLFSNTTKITGELHFDEVNVGPSYFTIKNMTQIKGDTASITFADNDYRVGNATTALYEITDEFEFTEIIEKWDTFVAKCDNYEGTSVTVVQYLGITTIDGVDYFMTWHLNAKSEDGIACEYPQIIQNSFDNDFGNIGHEWSEEENPVQNLVEENKIQEISLDKISFLEPNSMEFFYYPNPEDTKNRDEFQKFILIRLPESMGGGVNDVSAFRAYSTVSLSTDHCLVNYYPDPGRQNMQNPCWGGTYRAIDGLLIENIDPIMITSPIALPYLDLSIDENGALFVEPPAWNLQENGVISIGRQISMQEIHQGSQVLIDSYEKSYPYHPILPLEFGGYVLAEIHIGGSIEVKYFDFSSMSGYIYFDVDNVSAQDQQYFQNFVKSGAEYWQIEDVVVRIDGSEIEEENPKAYKHFKVEFIKDGFKFTIEGNELELIKRNIISYYFPENEYDDMVLISKNN